MLLMKLTTGMNYFSDSVKTTCVAVAVAVVVCCCCCCCCCCCSRRRRCRVCFPVCLFVCLFVCLIVCLLACLFVCLFVCLFACLLVCFFLCCFLMFVPLQHVFAKHPQTTNHLSLPLHLRYEVFVLSGWDLLEELWWPTSGEDSWARAEDFVAKVRDGMPLERDSVMRCVELHSLKLTVRRVTPENIGHPKRKRSYSNHPFSAVNSLLVSVRACNASVVFFFGRCCRGLH